MESAGYSPLKDRPLKNTICLFDICGTLSPQQGTVPPEILTLLHILRSKCTIGFVSGSDLEKQKSRLNASSSEAVTSLFDYSFAENGLVAYRLGIPLAPLGPYDGSFIRYLGEDRYEELVAFTQEYLVKLDIPFEPRGPIIELRKGMLNIVPVGAGVKGRERDVFEAWDSKFGTRKRFIKAMKERFEGWDLEFCVGGQVGFDVFPRGWDKTYCLRHLENEARTAKVTATGGDWGDGSDGSDGSGIGGVGGGCGTYTTIHFFGDKTELGGNDYHIFNDKRTIGHKVNGPDDTMRIVKELFML
ncbi:Phosphomannomutase [Arthrobotrys entomopaga]|nr:Phosphomannomutase [Arthrobotrys entomopaga]